MWSLMLPEEGHISCSGMFRKRERKRCKWLQLYRLFNYKPVSKLGSAALRHSAEWCFRSSFAGGIFGPCCVSLPQGLAGVSPLQHLIRSPRKVAANGSRTASSTGTFQNLSMRDPWPFASTSSESPAPYCRGGRRTHMKDNDDTGAIAQWLVKTSKLHVRSEIQLLIKITISRKVTWNPSIITHFTNSFAFLFGRTLDRWELHPQC